MYCTYSIGDKEANEVRSSQPAEALEGGGSLVPALQQGWTAG